MHAAGKELHSASAVRVMTIDATAEVAAVQAVAAVVQVGSKPAVTSSCAETAA